LDAPAHVLREVLVELLRNASRALEGRGKVTVCTSKEGLLYRLEVADDGCGITASMRELVFKPGFTTKQNSKGLGLFLAQRLVESHGGALYVDASEGSGARFVVDLPLAEGLPLISIGGSR
jgi:signal transduction histidine kinase